MGQNIERVIVVRLQACKFYKIRIFCTKMRDKFNKYLLNTKAEIAIVLLTMAIVMFII